MKTAITTILMAATALHSVAFDENDFASGVFVLNEDWYGHQNSTINMWYPDNDDDPYNQVYYRVFQSVNGMEIGATAQYGQIFGGKLYIMAKQHKDPGATTAGGRLTVVDAATMRCLAQLPVINPGGVAEDGGDSFSGVVSGSALGDGRACCGVTPDKVYLGTSNGIYILDTNTYDVTGCIPGTENELYTGDENNIDGQGPLYQNQIGIMIRTQDYVFAIKQDDGILVIDPATDRIVDKIEGCFSTMVQAADGAIYAGMNLASGDETNDFGVPLNHYPYGNNGSAWKGNGLLRIDPYTLETRQIDLYLGGVPQSWYAWTAGKLAASAKRNVLYFTYSDPSNGASSWFSDCMLYRYDIDRDFTELIYNSSIDGNLWFYSSSLRVSPTDDQLYCHFYYGSTIANQNWIYRRYTDEGSSIEPNAEWKLISNYWYPAMFIFPDNAAPEVSPQMPTEVSVGESPVVIDLSGMVTDEDTPQVSIVKRLVSNSNPRSIKAEIVRGELVLTSLEPGESSIVVQFDSNGKTVDHLMRVGGTYSGIDDVGMDDAAGQVRVYNMMGQLVRQYFGLRSEAGKGLAGGIYVVDSNGKRDKIYVK